MALLDDAPLIDFYLTIFPDGRTRLADQKLDTYDDATLDLIFRAALEAFCAWMAQRGKTPAAIIGDGGPEVARLRTRLYDALEEVAMLKGEVK